MYGLRFLSKRARCDLVRRWYSSLWHLEQQKQRQHTFLQMPSAVARRTFVTKRYVNKPQADTTNLEAPTAAAPADDSAYWPRKIFSGIQPTGSLHLGNYLGAVRKWLKLQEQREDVTFCIVDMHSITLPQSPIVLRDNIFQMAATILACGIDPNQSTVFVQSAVKEHSELCWLLSTLSTMARLGHLPQYKEKTRLMKEIPLGLFIYPVLQAADIMLYKTTHVPVGEDQLQHIQLAQHLAKIFNTRFGRTFPVCHAMIENKQISRIRSLRDPTKKMSKSDGDPKATLYVNDEPEIIVEKVKKAITDFCSDVSYDPEQRIGVSNLVAIHSQMTGQPIEKIIDEARALDTGKYKLRVADAIIEHFRPIREKIQKLLDDRSELVSILDTGSEKARNIACDTIDEVKQKMGLGAPYLPLIMDYNRGMSSPGSGSDDMGSEYTRQGLASLSGGGGGATSTSALGRLATATSTATAAATSKQQGQSHMLEAKLATLEMSRKLSAVPKPMVPKQQIRFERKPGGINQAQTAKKVPKGVVNDITKGLLSKSLLRRLKTERTKCEEVPEKKIRRIAGCVKVDPEAGASSVSSLPVFTPMVEFGVAPHETTDSASGNSNSGGVCSSSSLTSSNNSGVNSVSSEVSGITGQKET